MGTEWSRCPGCMTGPARDSVTPLERSATCWMPARLSQGVVDGRVNEADVRTACGTRQERSTLWLNVPGLR